MEEDRQSRPHILLRLWRGDERLWIAYWLFGVLGGWLVTTIVSNIVVFAAVPPLAGVIALLFYAAYTAVIVWRCAFQVNWWPWAYAARAILVISAAALIYEIAEGFHVF